MGRIIPGSSIPDEGELSRPEDSILDQDDFDALLEHEAMLQEAGTDFILPWQAYGTARTDAPVAFHTMAGVILAAAAIDRNRWLDLQHKRVYPSVYALLVARSGGRKSTPLAYAEAVARSVSVLRDRVLSNDYSPEALIEDLSVSKRRPVSRGVAFVDEAGRLFSTMRRDSYGEGLKDLLNRAWDAPPDFSRRLRKAEFHWRETYFTLLMATTPSRLADTLTPNDIASGFLPRFLPVWQPPLRPRKPLGIMTADVEGAGRALTMSLAKLRSRLAKVPGPIELTPAALDRLDRAEQALEAWAAREYHAEVIGPWARRLAEYASRLSIVMAASEGVDVVDEPQALRAIALVDRARGDVTGLVEDLMKTQQARAWDKVERFIRANPGITGRELQRRASIDAKTVGEITRELASQGRISLKGIGRGGPQYYPRLDGGHADA